MDRLENIRSVVDQAISKMQKEEDRKYAYLHLYGVSQCITLLAIHRHLQTEICAIAAMLHDFALYAKNCGHKDHALKSAKLAENILKNDKSFSKEEIALITGMIAKHSDKMQKDDNPYVEALKDADVCTHYLYNPQIPVPEQDKVRLFYLLEFIQQSQPKKE